MNIFFIALCILVALIFVVSLTVFFTMILGLLMLPNYSGFLKEKGKYKTFIITMVILGIIGIASMIALILMDKAGVMLI